MAHQNQLAGLRSTTVYAGGQFTRIVTQTGGTVYVGGFFTKVSGEDRNNLAAVGALGVGAVVNWNPAIGAGCDLAFHSLLRASVGRQDQQLRVPRKQQNDADL